MDTAEKIRFGFAVFGVAVLHFITTFMLTFIGGTTGGPFIRFLANALTFPASVLQGQGDDSSLAGWAVWVGTSFLWAFGLCWLARYLSHR